MDTVTVVCQDDKWWRRTISVKGNKRGDATTICEECVPGSAVAGKHGWKQKYQEVWFEAEAFEQIYKAMRNRRAELVEADHLKLEEEAR